MDTNDSRKHCIASFDGACEPYNPGGHMGIGWVLDGVSHSEYISAQPGNSNNVAEYLALTRVLEHAASHPEIEKLTVTGDSQLVCCQIYGEYAVRAESVRPFYLRAVTLLETLHDRGCKVNIEWLPREHNVTADNASKAALIAHGVTLVKRQPPTGYTKRLGDIGRVLDCSAVRVGKLLAACGLRENKQPTDRALAEGYACLRFDGFGQVVDWHIDRVVSVLRQQSVKATN